MKRMISYLAIFLIMVGYVHAQPEYTIDGDRVYIDTPQAYIEASPSYAINNDYVEVSIESKLWSGNIDICFGFDSDHAIPYGIQEKKEWSYNTTKSYTCESYNWFNYTLNPRISYCWNTEEHTDNNITFYNKTKLVRKQPFQWGNIQTSTVYWNETHLKNWKSAEEDFVRIDTTYADMDRWFCNSDYTVSSGIRYKYRFKLDSKIGTSGKYNIAVKPSHLSITESVNHNLLFLLDPWWNSTYRYRYRINSNATINIPININDTYAPNIWSLNNSAYYLICENSGCLTGARVITNSTGDQVSWENASSMTGYNPRNVWGNNNTIRAHMNNISAYDMSIYAEPVSVTGTPTSAVGVFGNANTFTQTSSYVTYSDGRVVGDVAMSLGCWFKTSDTSGTVISVGRTNTNYKSLRMNIDSTTGLTVSGYGSSSPSANTGNPSAVHDNNWHLGVGVYHGNDTVYVYLDGIHNSSGTAANNPVFESGADVTVATLRNQEANAAWGLSGTIDECFVYNRSLISREIQEIYYNGINNLTSLGDEEVFSISKNTNLKSVNIDISDFNFSSSSFVTAEQIFFNTSQTDNITVIGSMNTYKFGSVASSDISLRILIDDTIAHEELIRTVGGTIEPPYDQGVGGIKPFDYEIGTGEHNITIQFSRTGSGTVAIDDIDFSIIKFDTEENITIREEITDFSVPFSNTEYEEVFNWTIHKKVNSSTAFLAKMSITSTVDSTIRCSLKNNAENSNSPFIVRYVESGETGSAMINYIEEEESLTHNHSLSCKTTAGTATIEGAVLDFDLKDSSNNTISSFTSSNPNTDGESSISAINTGLNNIVNVTRPQLTNSSGLMILFQASIGTITGEQTALIFSNSTEINENILYSKKERYISGNDDIGVAFMAFTTGNIGNNDNNTYNSWINVESGETLILYDESFSGIEISPFSITEGNLAPIPNSIITPSNNTIVGGKEKVIDWLDFIDPNGDNVTYNVYTDNGTIQVIASGISATQTTINYTDYAESEMLIIVEGCDPSSLCSNTSNTVTVDNTPPILDIISPNNDDIIGTNQVTFLVSSSEAIDNWFYSTNDIANITFSENGTVTLVNGFNEVVVYGNDTAGNIGFDTVNVTITSFINTRDYCIDDDILLSIDYKEECDDAGAENCNITITRRRRFCDFGCSNNTVLGLGLAGCVESPTTLSLLTIIIIFVGAWIINQLWVR